MTNLSCLFIQVYISKEKTGGVSLSFISKSFEKDNWQRWTRIKANHIAVIKKKNQWEREREREREHTHLWGELPNKEA